MNNLIPDEFKINGDLTVRFDKQSVQETLLLMAMLILIIMILGFMAQRYIKKV